MYEVVVLKASDRRLPGAVISERWETNKLSPVVAPAYCLEKVSRPQCRERDLRQTLEDFLRSGDRALR